MSKKSEIDLVAQLSKQADSQTRAGKEQADKAIEKHSEEKKKPSKKEAPKSKKEVKPAKPKMHNMGLSLHPDDEARLFGIAQALRNSGIIGRPSNSLLIKVALAAFDPDKVEDLEGLHTMIKAQDGRCKV